MATTDLRAEVDGVSVISSLTASELEGGTVNEPHVLQTDFGHPELTRHGSQSRPYSVPHNGRREFKARHIQMMGLGASIGVGLLYQSGKPFALAGPVSFLFGWITISTVYYAVLISLGEMSSYLPLPGAWFALANRVISPSLGFSLGWVYWLTYLFGFPGKLVAIASSMRFWVPKTQVSPAVWITIFGLFPIAFNFFNVRRYGEIEFWFAATKMITIFGLIFLGVLLPMGASTATRLLGYDTTTHELIVCNNPATDHCVSPPGFDYWRETAFKPFLVPGGWGYLAGYWLCCCQAVYAHTGSEVIGITANEAERPRHTISMAVRRISAKLAFLYIGGAFVLGLNLSSNDPQLAWYAANPKGSYQGPFVLMIQRAGIKGLDHVVNAVVILAALSVANANLYETSRALYALASEGHAPKIFLRKNIYEVPWVGLLVSALPGSLAYLTLGKASSNSLFDFLTGMTTIGALIGWSAICATYLRFRQAYKIQNVQVVEAAKSPLQPVLAWYGLACTTFLTLFQGYLVFTRNNPYWGIQNTSWGYTTGPWVFISLFFLLIGVWFVVTRVRQEKWTWQHRPLNKIDLLEGAAPETGPKLVPRQLWRRIVQGALNGL